jgi:hypothetical protein
MTPRPRWQRSDLTWCPSRNAGDPREDLPAVGVVGRTPMATTLTVKAERRSARCESEVGIDPPFTVGLASPR